MRGWTILLATGLTFGYGFAAQAAMSANRAETYRRLAVVSDAPAPTPEEAATKVWYGGMMAPVTVEVPATPAAVPKCYLT